jgi:hypothetical protein
MPTISKTQIRTIIDTAFGVIEGQEGPFLKAVTQTIQGLVDTMGVDEIVAELTKLGFTVTND